jgi:hypothetical protein
MSMHLENPGREAWKAVARTMGYLKYNYRPLKLRTPLKLNAGGDVDRPFHAERFEQFSRISSE